MSSGWVPVEGLTGVGVEEDSGSGITEKDVRGGGCARVLHRHKMTD